MGPCRICNSPGCFGFGEPGHRKDRRKQGSVWACYEHESDVSDMWGDALRPDRPRAAPEQPLPDSDAPVSGGARNAAGRAGQLSMF